MSSVKGWGKAFPKTRSKRKSMKSRCGSTCFLKPSELKYPICSRGCSPDCRGLLAAYRRARQSNRAPSVARRALSIARRKRCSWIKK